MPPWRARDSASWSPSRPLRIACSSRLRAAVAAKELDWRDALVSSHRDDAPAAELPPPNRAADGPLAELSQFQTFEAIEHEEPEVPAELLQRLPRTAVRDYGLSILSAALVFTPVGLVHGGVLGYTAQLLAQSISACAIAGCSWSFLDAGRFRASMIGLAAYLIAFTTGSGQQDGGLMATFFGSLIALLGSGIVGLVREESPTRRPS